MTALSQSYQNEEKQSPGRPSWRWLYLLLGVAVTAILAFNIFQPITVLPRIRLSPGFLLQNQDGRPVTSEDYRGRLTLYSFTYTSCTVDCPLSLEQLAELRQELAAQAPQEIPLSMVTISLDPERDQAGGLSAEQQQLFTETGPVSWDFLTGDPVRTRTIVGGGFSLYYKAQIEESEENYTVKFEPQFILVDGWGIMRAEYRTSTPDLEIIVRDLRLITEEVQNSQGPGRLGYEAAHLFLCYPR